MRFIAKYLQVQANTGETVRIPYTKDDFEEKQFDAKGVIDSIEGNIVKVKINDKGETVSFPYKYIHKLFLCSGDIESKDVYLVYDINSETIIQLDDSLLNEIKKEKAELNYLAIHGEILTDGIKHNKIFTKKTKEYLTIK